MEISELRNDLTSLLNHTNYDCEIRNWSRKPNTTIKIWVHFTSAYVALDEYLEHKEKYAHLGLPKFIIIDIN